MSSTFQQDIIISTPELVNDDRRPSQASSTCSTNTAMSDEWSDSMSTNSEYSSISSKKKSTTCKQQRRRRNFLMALFPARRKSDPVEEDWDQVFTRETQRVQSLYERALEEVCVSMGSIQRSDIELSV